jgi:tetratricopeptide (TPR) repeat protein
VAVAKKLSKKALKQPDQFVGFWEVALQRVGRFAAANAKVLVIGTSALATVIAGSVVMSYVSEARAEKSSMALDRVQKIASADLITPAAPKPDKADSIPHFATEKERLEGALKELDGHFASGHAALGPEAALVRGGLLLDLGRADEAQADYEKILSGKLDPRLRFLAREGLGYAYERKGKLAEAQAAFAKLGSDAAGMGNFYKDRARYHEARIAELQGNPGEAARIYHEVLDKNPTTSLREEITNRLAALEMK